MVIYFSVLGYAYRRLFCISRCTGLVFAVMGGMIYVIIRHRGRVADLTMKQMLIMAAFSLYFGFASEGVDNAAHARWSTVWFSGSGNILSSKKNMENSSLSGVLSAEIEP